MLDEFRRIAETATPHAIQSRLVTPDEARAVISSFNRLTDPLRTNFLALPVDNIIEFSMMQTKKRPSLYNYMNGVTESIVEPPPEAPQVIPETEHLDQPDTPEPVVEEEKPKAKPKKPRLAETRPIEAPRSDEKFFRHLTERLEALVSQAPSIVVETTEKHVEKLLEVEQAMLATIATLTERVEQLSANTDDTRTDLTETLAMQRDMIGRICESQAQIGAIQSKLIESNTQIVETLGLLTDKIATLIQTPPVVNPVVNVPAPIVNVTMQEGRRTKVVERDENNLITKITEGYEES